MRVKLLGARRARLLVGGALSVLVAVLIVAATDAGGSGATPAWSASAAGGTGPGIECCGYGNVSDVGVHVTSSNLNSNNTVEITFSTYPSGSRNTVWWGLNSTYQGYESGSREIGTLTEITLGYMNPGTTFWFSIVSQYSEPGVEWIPGEYSGNFSTQAIPNHAWHTANVMGYALGSNGLPLPAEYYQDGGSVNVVGNYSAGASGCATFDWPTTALAGQNGSYSLPATIVVTSPDIGTCYLTGWSAYGLTGLGGTTWTESWTLYSEPNNATGWNWQTFYLSTPSSTSIDESNSDGGQNGVYAALAFVHTTNAGCAVQSGYSVTNSVYAYVGGSGGTVTQGYSAGDTFPAGGPTSDYGDSPGIATQYDYQGTYAIEPGGGVSIVNLTSVAASGVINNVFYTGSDPVSRPPAIDVQTSPLITVPAGYTANFGFYANGSVTLQFGVEMSVGVSVGVLVSVTVSTDISFGISGTQSTYSGVSCTIGSSSSNSTQYFEIYNQGASPGNSFEQGVEEHIWQCDAASGGGAPSSCTPTDLP